MSEISRAVLFGKLDTLLFTSLESATAFCKLRGNPYVELVHWLHQLMQQSDGDLQQVIRHFSLDEQALTRDIVAALDKLPRGASSVSDLSEHIDTAVERAWVYGSLKFGVTRIRGGHLLAGILKTWSLANVLKGISPQFDRVSADALLDNFDTICANSKETQQATVALNDESGVAAPTQQGTLAQYGQDLTARARDGKIDPVVGRDEEIRQMVDILMRRRQNNPLLTGEAGVGKTAVVEGLALRIAAGDVPAPLRDVQLWLLDIGMLQAGAGMKGEFEARLQALINEVQSSPTPIVLFVDEIHTLVGAGGQQGTGDAANLLKPALARGQLRTIGATTRAKYKKCIKKDPALTRRFQTVQVQEPDEAKAILMLRSTVSALEKHHRVLLLDDAVSAAVKLSHRYIPARQLPDKAVALLDTACARVAVSQGAQPAALEDCLHRLAALEIEAEIIEREIRVGLGDATRQQAIAAQRTALEAERDALQQRWLQERELVETLIALRARCVTEEDAALREQRDATQQQLTALQGDTPLLFAAVDAGVVAAVVSDWTGIPLGRMVKNEIDAVLNLADTLNQRVIGQRHGLDLIARRVRTSRARLDNPNKPVGVFMLCGPSGVGKTETALALAESLYGGEQNIITINMSEFQEAHTVSTLKGAPPGYVGYGQGGILTEAVRKRPYSVVLLDEVEKAHRDVMNLFYQVFDRGVMRDGEGREIDFRNTVILMTANLGSDLLMQLLDEQPEASESDLHELLRPVLRGHFQPALLARFQTVIYRPLPAAALRAIVGMKLGQVSQRLACHYGITTTLSESLFDALTEACLLPDTGARNVDSLLNQQILPALSQQLLSHMAAGQKPRQVTLGYHEEEGVVMAFDEGAIADE